MNSQAELLQTVAATVGKLHKITNANQERVTQALQQRSSLFQLPPVPAGFVGRDSDLIGLRNNDTGTGTVITGIKGMGGIGKTALAIVFATELRERFPDAQLFINAKGTQQSPPPPSSEDLLSSVIRNFLPDDLLPSDLAALQGLYQDVLSEKRALIVIDNAKDSAQVSPLLPPTGSGLVVTSRASFVLGTSAPRRIGQLTENETYLLLREFYPSLEHGSPETEELIQLCAGLPLAARLAGAHLAIDAADRGGKADVKRFLSSLRKKRLQVLDSSAADTDLATISGSFEVSENSLSTLERSTWRRLGIFKSSFDKAAARAVADAGDVEEMLESFVRRCMLDISGDSGERYVLHDLASEFAFSRMPEDERYEVSLAFARHFADLCAESDQQYRSGNPSGGLAAVDRERLHIIEALEWLEKEDHKTEFQAQADSILVNLVESLAYTGEMRFHPQQRIIWLNAQSKAARRVAKPMYEASAYDRLGIAYWTIGDVHQAIANHEKSLEIARDSGSLDVEAKSLGNLGNAYYHLGEYESSSEYYGEALELFRHLQNRLGENCALAGLGLSYGKLGRYEQAFEVHEQCLRLAIENGDRRIEGTTYGNIGLIHSDTGNYEEAIKYHNRDLSISREMGDQRSEAIALGDVGNASMALGNFESAIQYFREQIEVAQNVGARRQEAEGSWSLAKALHSIGDADQRKTAIKTGKQGLEIFESLAAPEAEGVRREIDRWEKE
ncbi:MAG: tetratricopeptide repeat protein [Verrucomicrobiota bacterium]